MDVDREVLAAIFASRIALAKKTLDQAVDDAKVEHRKAVAWLKSDSTKERSFLWYCEEFDLDPGAVRRAIGGKK